jgi:hypothetical protein
MQPGDKVKFRFRTVQKGEEIMGRAKDDPGCKSGLQLTLALLHQVQGDGICWRRLSQRSGCLVRTSRPWTGLSPASSGAPVNVPEPHSMKEERWS